jgi:spore maturation protein CgeB
VCSSDLKIPNVVCDLYGLNKINPIWGDDYFKKLAQSKMALNLSRGKAVKYYSSDRISSLIPNGITTFIDIKTNLNNFFNDNEVVFYKNINDLAESINYLKINDKKRREIGRNGRIKYQKYFNNQLVTNFMVEKTFNLKFSQNYQWI